MSDPTLITGYVRACDAVAFHAARAARLKAAEAGMWALLFVIGTLAVSGAWSWWVGTPAVIVLCGLLALTATAREHHARACRTWLGEADRLHDAWVHGRLHGPDPLDRDATLSERFDTPRGPLATAW